MVTLGGLRCCIRDALRGTLGIIPLSLVGDWNMAGWFSHMTLPIGSMYDPCMLLYMVIWIPSIYPIHVSIYTSTMDPSWVGNGVIIPTDFHEPIIFQRGRLKRPRSYYWDIYDPPSIGIFWIDIWIYMKIPAMGLAYLYLFIGIYYWYMAIWVSYIWYILCIISIFYLIFMIGIFYPF